MTGSSGRIGSAIVEQLRHDNRPVIGVDLLPSLTTDVVTGRLAGIDNAGIRNEIIERLATQASAVIHCAALHAPHVGRCSDQAFWLTNVELTKQLIRNCPPTSKFIYTSSTSVYGHALQHQDGRCVWIDESVAPEPRDIYDVTKLAAEELLKKVADAKRSITVLRVSRCFPEDLREMTLYRLHRGVDVRDVVQAHLLALECNSSFSRYVISGPPVFDRSELTALANNPWPIVLKHYPTLKHEFARRGWAPPKRFDRVYSSASAISELGYQPQYDVLSLLP